MRRPISTKTHGLIDYAWATVARSATARLDRAAGETARLVERAGLITLASAMLTNYEAGMIRVLPMKGHLALDYLMCAVLLASPLFLPRAERRFAAVPMLLGAAGLVTSLLTQARPAPTGPAVFEPTREMSEAVADPNPAGRSG